MIQENYRKSDVDRLVQRLREDDLDEAGQAALRDIIRNHPKERRRVAQQLYVEAHLKEALGLPIEGGGGKEGGGGRVLLLIGGMIFMGVMAVWWWGGGGGKKEEDSPVAEGGEKVFEQSAVAVLSRRDGVSWMEGIPLEVVQRDGRSLLRPGVLEIEGGRLQVDFYTGATVLVEGPARFEVIGADSGFLHFGRATAKVPSAASNFRMHTPQFVASNSGVEYALQVGADDEGEIHVFGSKVTVGDEAGREQVVEEQTALRFAGGASSEVPLRDGDFLRPWILDEKARLRLKGWEDLRTKLINDPDVILFYGFGNSSEWRRDIPNEAVAGPPDTDGAVVGCFSTEGRWPGKRALGFENSSNRVRLQIPGSYAAVTLSTWIRKDAVGERYTSLLHSEREQERSTIWSVISPAVEGPELGKVPVYSHFVETTTREAESVRHRYHANENLGPLFQAGKWVHLAVVYDSPAARVRHYANGKLVWENEITVAGPVGFGVADLGNWPYRDWAEGTEFEVRNIEGAMGEFLIAKRAFTEGEIREIYEKGKP
ncbi:MAG: LamG-like jellyroll fold domain-containing protein [Verrucomicrobiaceae bacterium]